MKEDFVKNLLKAFDDEKVQRKITEICTRYENGKVRHRNGEDARELQKITDELQRKNGELQSKLTECIELQERNKELENRLNIVQIEKRELLQKIESIQMDCDSQIGECKRELQRSSKRIQELEQECSEYKDKYGKIEYYYQRYCAMGGEVHRKLERILSADSPEMFLSWGTQWDNIKALWTEISYWLQERPKEEADRLIEIFDYFFDLYYENNQKNGQKKYVRQEVREGDEFDAFRHTRSSKSAVAGNITEILLRGYGQMDGEDFELREKSVVKI